MDEIRPIPEVFLSRLQREDRRGRGRLKVFFGMSAGVGKTYAMLETAQALRVTGKDVLVGVVETHGRAETEALLEGLPILPRREREYRGMRVREFDLDAALKRKPAAVVVDELAHSNGPGSRHAKRHRDVEELLAAGIDVLTAINVQHVESLNDAVAQITGIRVRETVPDAILEGADEVVLMDLPPEGLLLRLREGKVYLGEQAERTAEMFLKPSNLAALRELALRFVAERVGARVEGERHDSGSSAIWPTRERLLVGVGPAPSSARLIRSTKRLAGARIDLDARQVFRDGQEVRLTPNEWKVLAALARHAGKVVTQKQLLREVWGAARPAQEHYVRVYVHQIRQKIEANRAMPRLLITEPWVGYRLKTE